MSQALYSSRYAGQPIDIPMTCDRSLQGFFRGITFGQVQQDDCVDSNLEDPALLGCGGLPNFLNHFLAMVDARDLTVGQAMGEQIAIDVALHVAKRSFRDAQNDNAQH